METAPSVVGLGQFRANVSRETLPHPATKVATDPPLPLRERGWPEAGGEGLTHHNVSRETVALRAPSRPFVEPRRRLRVLRGSKPHAAIVAIAALALLAAACGKPPGPAGWAPAQPVKIDAAQVILVAHRAKLYALPEGSSNPNWQFPPKDKNAYAVSSEANDDLTARIDALSIDATPKSDLKRKLADLRLAGPTKDDFKKTVDTTGAPDADKSALKSRIDDIVTTENSAINNLKAMYGDIGVSSDGKTAYLTTFRGVVFALDTSSGATRWIRDTHDEIVGGVAVDNGTVYFGTKGNRVYALDGKTAEQTWSFGTKGEVWATPTVDGDGVYVTSLDGSVYALDKATGNQRWRFAGPASGVASRAVVAGDAVYAGAFDNKLYSMKKSDGTLNWSIKAGNWFWAAPVVSGGAVYAASLDGKVYAVDAATGDQKWAPFDTGSAVRAGPTIAGGGLVVASRNGRVNKLDLATGQPSEGSPLTAASTILSDLVTAVDGKTVYVVPDSAALLVLDASGALQAPGSYPLPQ